MGRQTNGRELSGSANTHPAPSSQCVNVLRLRLRSLIASQMWDDVGRMLQVTMWLLCSEAACEATSSQTGREAAKRTVENSAAALKACSAPSPQCANVLMFRLDSLIASKMWDDVGRS